MNFGYYVSPEAESDIDEIITYIAQENTSAAYQFLDALYDAMEKNYLIILTLAICVRI